MQTHRQEEPAPGVLSPFSRVRSTRLKLGGVLLAIWSSLAAALTILSLPTVVSDGLAFRLLLNNVAISGVVVGLIAWLGITATGRLWRTGSSRMAVWASLAWVALSVGILPEGGGWAGLLASLLTTALIVSGAWDSRAPLTGVRELLLARPGS